jgi:dienelactone hydrolase
VTQRPTNFPLPSALAAQARFERLGPGGVIPVLLAHPDWTRPAPTVLWLHGRTVSKELDNGRYLRWLRAGLATVAIDMPGHGERFDASLQDPARTLEVIAQAVGEIDLVLAGISGLAFGGAFDAGRLAIGGMSAGGMVTLRRLCEAHLFRCATVEGSAGDLGPLYLDPANPARAKNPAHDVALIARLSAMNHLDRFRPLPLLALHSRADKVVPLACIERFTTALEAKVAAERAGGGPDVPITLHTWESTGVHDEHSGFGRVAAEAKTVQLEFLLRHLG